MDLRVMRGIGKLVLVGIFFLSIGEKSLAANCGECNAILQKIQQNMNAKAQHKNLLEKNRQYLASLPNDATSKRIKFGSNVVLIGVNLETIENNIQHLNDEMKRRRCDQCRSPIIR